MITGKKSSQFFTNKGKLKKISKLEMWPLKNVLHEKYKMEKEYAEWFADFLLPMLSKFFLFSVVEIFVLCFFSFSVNSHSTQRQGNGRGDVEASVFGKKI